MLSPEKNRLAAEAMECWADFQSGLTSDKRKYPIQQFKAYLYADLQPTANPRPRRPLSERSRIVFRRARFRSKSRLSGGKDCHHQLWVNTSRPGRVSRGRRKPTYE